MSTRSNSAALTLLVAFVTACGGGPAPTVPVPTPAPAPEPPTVPDPEPRECTDEREMALMFGEEGQRSSLVRDWDEEGPFRFYADSRAMTGEHADEVLKTARELAKYIEDQIGYPIFEVMGKRRAKSDFDPDSYCAVAGGPGEIVASALPGLDGGRAALRCAVIFWGPETVTVDGIVPHELFNLFGFRDHGDDEKGPYGVEMSYELNNPHGPERQWPTYEDVDALRCIFPSEG